MSSVPYANFDNPDDLKNNEILEEIPIDSSLNDAYNYSEENIEIGYTRDNTFPHAYRAQYHKSAANGSLGNAEKSVSKEIGEEAVKGEAAPVDSNNNNSKSGASPCLSEYLDRVFESVVRPIGFYQLVVVLGTVFFTTSAPANTLTMLAAIVPPHRCHVPALARFNLTYDEVTQFAIPLKSSEKPSSTNIAHNLVKFGYETCERWVLLPSNTSGTHTMPRKTGRREPCLDGHVFDERLPQHRGTVIQTFDAVCGRAYLQYLITTAYLVGMFLGGLLGSSLGQRLGRRKVIIGAMSTCTLLSVWMSFTRRVSVWLVLRVCIGCLSYIGYVAAFLLISETTSSKWRSMLCWILSTFSYLVVGLAILIMPSYFLGNWRSVNIIITVFMATVFVYALFGPESPRWLISKGHLARAELEIRRAARLNGNTTAQAHNFQLELPTRSHLSSTQLRNIARSSQPAAAAAAPPAEAALEMTKFCSLRIFRRVFGRPKLRATFISMVLIWNQVAFFYYWITYTVTLEAWFDPYIMLVVTAVAIMLAELTTAIVYKYCSRLRPLFGLLCVLDVVLAAAVVYLCVVSSNSGNSGVNSGVNSGGGSVNSGGSSDTRSHNAHSTTPNKFVMAALNIVIGICTTSLFNMLYIFTAEIFPTDVRSFCMGGCSCFCRIGAAFGPVLVLLGQSVWLAFPYMLALAFCLLSTLLCVFWLPDFSPHSAMLTNVAEFDQFTRTGVLWDAIKRCCRRRETSGSCAE